MNRRNYALYFSRAPIPWCRGNFENKKNINLNDNPYFRHIGIYAYRAGFLQEYIAWGACPTEELEKLEQLRILWHGGRIHLQVYKGSIPIGVDTEEDLLRVRALCK
jgi:3-deoxy-manno-octulosonate cytidylyltransferase (CMP-KDO synthetase)